MDLNRGSKNWFLRLATLTFRPARTSTHHEEEVTIRRNTQEDSVRTRRSFRRSLQKMHARIKSAVSRRQTQPPGNRSHSNTPNTSNLDVMRQSKPAENFYSVEPVKQLEAAEQLDTLSDNNHKSSSLNRLEEPVLENRGLLEEIFNLSRCPWYWGPLNNVAAEERLRNCPDGAFLVRDSSSNNYLFSISFRSVGKTLHSRIEYSNGRFSLYDREGFPTVSELIQNAMKVSAKNVYCYSRNGEYNPNFPVRLTKPIGRDNEVRSLKYLSWFVIKKSVREENLTTLPLPPVLLNYLLRDGEFF